MNQRRTKDEPKNAEIENVRFIKIAVSFTSLIPCVILPTDDRENTERAPHQLLMTKSTFLMITFLKRLSIFPKKVFFLPKKVDSFPNMVKLFSLKIIPASKLKMAKKSPFSCINAKKSVSLHP